MNYPGHLIKSGTADAAVVNAIQGQLAEKGYGPFTRGIFDDAMKSMVSLFQSQHVDREGRRLKPDGVVGPMTWGAIFGGATVPPRQTANATSALAQAVLDIAHAQLGVMEDPIGSNSGPRVNEYLTRAGIDPQHTTADQRFWCMAFVYWCVDEAANRRGVANPLVRTPGVLDQWDRCANRSGVTRIAAADVQSGDRQVAPGHILILDHGHRLGHTGIVSAVDGPHLFVVEGNANSQANSRNGIGVFETHHRTIGDSEVKGFLAF